MPKYKYYICDVFTETRFGGNPLAVLPEAIGLTSRQMQQIAREFNFSESTFVFPAEQGQTRQVRIFTPTQEVPFAGHPNIGTAFVLATSGAFGTINGRLQITFEEKAGLVPIDIHQRPKRPFWCELQAPEGLSLGQTVSVEQLATAVSLTSDDILTTTHPPIEASVGLPFLFAELKDRAALERARINMIGLDTIVAAGKTADIHLYTRCPADDSFDLRARMFAPLDGVPEDPATGSANCALAGLLAHHAPDGTYQWRIGQGIEMGRPSLLDARASKTDGLVTGTWVGGSCVMVSEGMIEIN